VEHTELKQLDLTAAEMTQLEAFPRAVSGPFSLPPELLRTPR
jgi:hypothetical protein